MSERVRYARLGVFVVAAAVLAAGALIALGAGDAFKTKYLVEAYIDESVQGLDPGAAVKFRGVQVGRVEEIGFARSTYEVSDARVRVVVALMPDDAASLGRGDPDQVFRAYVENGLRVRLASQGLTGGVYLELDMLDAAKHPPPDLKWKPHHPVLPAVASTGNRLLSSAESFLVRLERVKIDELVERLVKLAEDVRGEIKPVSEDARTLIADVKLAMKDVMAFVKEDVAPVLREIRQAAAKTGPAFEKAEAALSRVDAVLARMDRTLAGGGAQAEETLENLRVATQDLRELMGTLKRYPATAVFGDAPAKPRGMSK